MQVRSFGAVAKVANQASVVYGGKLNYLKIVLIMLVCLVISVSAEPLDVSSQAERVLYFGSEITVNKDTTLTVTETIKVRCANVDIMHGIYRDFPTKYVDKYGNKVVVGFKVLDVERDGHPEDCLLYHTADGVSIKIGSPYTILKPGDYTYKITYKVTRELGFYRDHDELYWNVTGNGWKFPIDKVKAIVTLPKEIPSSKVKLEAYTGLRGAIGRSYKAGFSGSRIVFQTTSPLSRGRGMTIVVSFPKGSVEAPSTIQKLRYLVADNRASAAGLFGFLAVMGYFAVAWLAVGRDPKKGTVVPVWEIPGGLSPAAVRYIAKKKIDDKAATAAIVSMAVKNYLTILDEESGYSLKKAGKKHGHLSPEEDALADQLIRPQCPVVISGKYNYQVARAIIDFTDSLKSSFAKKYFATNRGYFAVGVLLSLASIVSYCVVGIEQERIQSGAPILLVLLAVSVFASALQLRVAISAWRNKPFNVMAICTRPGSLTFIPFVLSSAILLYYVVMASMGKVLVVAIPFIVLNGLFYRLLETYTREGRAVMDKIDGFKLYLKVAEKDRLELLNPPDKTPEFYERFLPYAIALDVEDDWSRQFTDVLEDTTADEQGYSPSWWHSSGSRSSGMTGFVSSFSGSMSGAIASSLMAPGSSSGSGSGSGGGGSSGGGGGGGGGGGW